MTEDAIDIFSKNSIGIELLPEKSIVENSFDLPGNHKTGVYFLVKGDKVVYVGRALNILQRVSQHFKSKDFDRFFFVECEKNKLDTVESLYIHRLNPALNGGTISHLTNAAPLPLSKLLECDGVNFTVVTKENKKPETRIKWNCRSFVGITEDDLEQWQAAYPAVAVPAAIRQMEAWLVMNEKRRKELKDFGRFIINWLAKEQRMSDGRMSKV